MKQVDLHDKLKLVYTEVEDGNIDERFGNISQVKENRKKIFKQLKLKSYELIEGQQIHFSRILALNVDNTKMWRGYNITGVDGFTTDQKDVALMLRVADCVPLVMYDPDNQAMAVVHVGWKGATLGIEKVAINQMISEYKTDVKSLLVWMGPSAQGCCYISKEKPEQVEDKAWKPFISKKKDGYQVDLPNYLAASLKKEGLLKKNMIMSDVCTIEDEHVFSHQRSEKNKEAGGRFAVIAQLV